jgi:hypothetical protein
MSNNKVLKVLSAALVIGILGVGTAAQAETDNSSDHGGFVVPGSTDGVNPADHPGILGNAAAAKAYGYVPTHHVQSRRASGLRD